jgi:hypothetical protein
VALQLFWLLSFLPEPLSMTAQSLIARDATDRPQVVKTAWLLVRMAGFLSVMLAGLVAMTFLFGSYLFTTDQDIIDGVHDLVVPVRSACSLPRSSVPKPASSMLKHAFLQMAWLCSAAQVSAAVSLLKAAC